MGHVTYSVQLRSRSALQWRCVSSVHPPPPSSSYYSTAINYRPKYIFFLRSQVDRSTLVWRPECTHTVISHSLPWCVDVLNSWPPSTGQSCVEVGATPGSCSSLQNPCQSRNCAIPEIFTAVSLTGVSRIIENKWEKDRKKEEKKTMLEWPVWLSDLYDTISVKMLKTFCECQLLWNNLVKN